MKGNSEITRSKQLHSIEPQQNSQLQPSPVTKTLQLHPWHSTHPNFQLTFWISWKSSLITSFWKTVSFSMRLMVEQTWEAGMVRWWQEKWLVYVGEQESSNYLVKIW